MFDAPILDAAPLQELRQRALKLVDCEGKEGAIADRAARFPAGKAYWQTHQSQSLADRSFTALDPFRRVPPPIKLTLPRP